MTEAIAMKWVSALRSGKYKQTKGALKDEHGFCCLGVLHEVMGVKAIGEMLVCHYDNFSKLGIKTEKGLLRTADASKTMCLSGLNDNGYVDADLKVITDPLTFDEIADVIQMTYEEL